MKKKRKSLLLQFFVYLIIFALLFSVVAVTAVYLRGTQQREVQIQQAAQELAENFNSNLVVSGNAVTASGGNIQIQAQAEEIIDVVEIEAAEALVDEVLVDEAPAPEVEEENKIL